jgi:hypothetical protein
MATKKTSWQKSEFGKIKWVNIFNAVYHAVIAVGTLYFAEPASTLQTLGILGASTFFFSVFKGASTNSEGVPFKGEK